VVKKLDKPVDELLKVLMSCPEKPKVCCSKPSPIEDALHQPFPAVLSPVTKPFADLFAKVDAVLT
jgi:hypothetical protein